MARWGGEREISQSLLLHFHKTEAYLSVCWWVSGRHNSISLPRHTHTVPSRRLTRVMWFSTRVWKHWSWIFFPVSSLPLLICVVLAALIPARLHPLAHIYFKMPSSCMWKLCFCLGNNKKKERWCQSATERSPDTELLHPALTHPIPMPLFF